MWILLRHNCHSAQMLIVSVGCHSQFESKQQTRVHTPIAVPPWWKRSQHNDGGVSRYQAWLRQCVRCRWHAQIEKRSSVWQYHPLCAHSQSACEHVWHESCRPSPSAKHVCVCHAHSHTFTTLRIIYSMQLQFSFFGYVVTVAKFSALFSYAATVFFTELISA